MTAGEDPGFVPGDVSELRTERLLLRRWAAADLEAFADMNADPAVMRYFPAPLTRSESEALLARLEQGFAQRGVGLWAVETRDTTSGHVRFVGLTGLNPMPDGVPGEGELEVGWRLARWAWGRGYATEAARAAVSVAFTALALRRVWSHTAVVNRPSQRVMRRLGMVPHAIVDHPCLPDGHWLRPHAVYRLDAPTGR